MTTSPKLPAANNDEHNRKTVFKYLLVALVSLVFADGIITRFLVFENIAVEGNPFLREWVRDDWFLLLKLVGAMLCAFVLWLVFQRKRWITLVVSSILVVFYIGVIFWNLFVFFLV